MNERLPALTAREVSSAYSDAQVYDIANVR